MDTDIMARLESRVKTLLPVEPKRKCLSLLLMVGFASTAEAAVWGVTLKPTITISQSYSDNLTLRPASLAQSGFVTQLDPSLNIVRDTANTKFNLHSRLQYLYYEDISLSPRLYPQLQMTSKTELYDDSIFVDSSSTVGQGNSSSIGGGVSSSNIYQSPFTPHTTYRTFRFSPYWTPHFGGYAEGEVRFGYYHFGNSTSSSPTSTATGNSIGNLGTDTYQESLNLKSGRKFNSSSLSWRLSANNQNQRSQTSSGSNLRFRNANGEISQRLFGDISAFIQTGYYDNQYSGNTVAKNGIYVTPGLSWSPSPNFSFAAGYGYNAYFSNVNWNPSERTSFQLTYRNSQVGGSAYGSGSGFGGLSSTPPGFNYNQVGGSSGQAASNSATGALGATNAGTTWNGSFNHRARTTHWNASYYTTTTTIQQILASTQTFATQYDAQGNPITSATAIERPINQPNLTDGIVISKNAQASVTWTLPKSNLTLSGYHRDYTYSTNNSPPQKTLGITASWIWRFSPRMSAMVNETWQSSEYQGSGLSASNNRKTEYLSASVSLNRQISSFVSSSLQFYYIQSNANNINAVGNVLASQGTYESNRITANLFISF